jgi:hypothetical protein
MANLVYNRGKMLAGLGHVSTSAAFRLMLVTTCYEGLANLHDHNLVDDGTTTDPKSYELTVGGYGRGSVAGLTLVEDDTNDFAFLDATDQTFSALVAGETIGGAVLYIYSSSGGSLGTQTSDTGQELVAFYDLTNTPTNGGDITIAWASTTAGGFFKFGSTS